MCGSCNEIIDYPQLYVLEKCDNTFHYECIKNHIQNSVLFNSLYRLLVIKYPSLVLNANFTSLMLIYILRLLTPILWNMRRTYLLDTTRRIQMTTHTVLLYPALIYSFGLQSILIALIVHPVKGVIALHVVVSIIQD